MGASVSIFYVCSKKTNASCILLDSPYDRLMSFIKKIANKKAQNVPSFLISGAISMIESKIKEKTGVSISKINPIEFAPQIKCPSLWLVAKNDEYFLPFRFPFTFD